MFTESINVNYSGMDATVEIILMLLVSFVLGYIIRLIQDRMRVENTTRSLAPRSVRTNTVVIESEMKNNDLKVVEGIGPKIEEILNTAGIKTWKKLSETSAEKLKEILITRGGERFRIHEPTTWPEQARLALEGKWDDLKEYQSFLTAGK